MHHRICRLKRGRLEPLPVHDQDGHRSPLPNGPRGAFPYPLCPTGLAMETGGSLLCTYSEEGTFYRIDSKGGLQLLLGIPPNHNYSIGELWETVAPKDVSRVPLNVPTGLVRRSDGTIFLIEREGRIVRKFNLHQGLMCVFPPSRAMEYRRKSRAPERTPLSEFHPALPTALALDSDEVLYVADGRHGCVLRVDEKAGAVERVVEDVGATGRLNWVSALAFGPDGTAWVLYAKPARVYSYEVRSTGAWKPLGITLTAVGGESLRGVPGGAGIAISAH
jgi:hypothetical protein